MSITKDEEYLLLGSNNEWYSTCKTMGEVIEELARIKEAKEEPEVIYVFKAVEVDRVYKDN